MKWLYKLDYKYGRHAIENLMYYIVGGMAVMYVMDLILYNADILPSLISLLEFNKAMILKGQVWRIISFVFLPPNSSILFIVISLYFYYMIGTTLEKVWGSFRFNLYYLFGIIGTIIFGFITGYTTNYYLNMSLFLAFAVVAPDYELRVFYMIPIKVKYLAILDAVILVAALITEPLADKVALIVAVANFILFFAEDLLLRLKRQIEYIKSRRNFRR